jgi:hypothetical protein
MNTACPQPDLVLASYAGELPSDLAWVAEHVAHCPLCQSLGRDLSSLEQPGLSAEEAVRIRERVAAAMPGPWWWRRPAAWAIAAGIAAAAVTGWVLRTPALEPPPRPVVVAMQHQPPPVRVPVSKPVLRLPAEALVLRGEDGVSQAAFLKQYGSAVEPYRRDDFAEAAARLDVFLKRYPDCAEGHFYRGVSLLFLKRNEEAERALGDAVRLAAGDLQKEAEDYLATARRRDPR